MKRVVVVLVLGLLGQVGGVAAHTFEPALLDLRERDPGVFDVVWRPPGEESGGVLPGDPALVPVLPAHCRRLLDLESDEERLAFRVDCGPTRLRGETIAVPGIAGSRVDAIVRLTWNDGRTASGVLRSDSAELVVPDEPGAGMLAPGAPALTVARRYLALGVAHILHGYDHVLFVVGLFLLVGSTRALVTTISAFTLAHSLTLAAAALGLVDVPSAPVEATIALSIVLLARELVRTADEPATLTRRYPWAVAFTFGLLHGLGFAGALAETGVPADQIPLALVAFNLGVEAGQLLIVSVLLALAATIPRRLVHARDLSLAPDPPPRARGPSPSGAPLPARSPLGRALRARRSASWVRRLAAWPWLHRVVPYAMGTLAVAWTIERVLRF